MKHLITIFTILISSMSFANLATIGHAESDTYIIDKSHVEKVERRGHCTQGPFSQRQL